MTTKGKRRGGQPLIIQNSTATALDRIPLEERTFTEDWIQKLIFNTPEVLPVNEIETGFSPLIPIGREIATSAGYIDNLFISPEGYLTIVETKLWRNPEARRIVVSQILDYAKELGKWTFTDLDNSIKAFNQLHHNNADGIIPTVRKHTELFDEDEGMFIDSVSKNLKRGRFLLLIVGDGIRESVEDMVEYLEQNSQLYFTLALVELQVYQFSNDNDCKMVIPQLITRTREITRAIVRIEGNPPPDFKINIETDLGTAVSKQSSATSSRLTITAQDFFDQLEKNTNSKLVEFANEIIKDCEEMGLVLEWNTSSFGVKLIDPQGSGKRIALFTVDRAGYVYLGYSKDQFEKLQLPSEICYRFSADTAAMLPGIKQNPERKHVWVKYSTLNDLMPVYQRFRQRVKQYVDEIISEGQKMAAKTELVQ
jgi:hypothetical protein